jgi:ABC-2 type transport system permease protein
MENFAGTMNFVIFPMFFISSALYPLWKLRESGAIAVYWLAEANPFTYCVELIRFALYGMFNATAAVVVVGCGLLFFLIATIGYNPQRGLIRRAPSAA